MIATEHELSYQEMQRRARTRVCGECGGVLTVAWGQPEDDFWGYFLRCGNDIHHKSMKPIDNSAEDNEIKSKLQRRDKRLATQVGEKNERALVKYQGITSLTKQEAREIILTCYPKAPEDAVKKAVIICTQYGLNPLMKHVFLLPFKERDDDGKIIGTNYEPVIGIKATRIIAARQGKYSYYDGTPRVMSEEEQLKTFGEKYDDRICAITKIKDEFGNEAQGYGFWLKNDKVHGSEKGNSAFNMACIHSERQAFDRLFPGALPQEAGVTDEAFVPTREVQVEVVSEAPAALSGTPTTPEYVFKNYGQLCQVCWDKWSMMPRDILNELNKNDSSEIKDFNEAFNQIASVRKAQEVPSKQHN